jgi:hypothetical protein
MFHANEEAKFNFDIIDIFVPDTKTCIRYVRKVVIFRLVFYLKIAREI